MNKMRIQAPEESLRNKFAGDSRANQLVSAVYEALWSTSGINRTKLLPFE